jgi:hypothetical protein
MIPFEEALEATLHKLGLAEPAVMLQIRREWEEVAGSPWATQAVPLYLQRHVLVVELQDRAAMSFLRYGVAELEARLANRFGREVVQRVDLRPPGRNPGGVP